MDRQEKVKLLARAAQYDLACGACGTHAARTRDDLGRWLYPSVLPDGRRVSLFKVLQSNYCENDCAYCANRRSRDTRRIELQPDELAALFNQLVERNLAQGLFLSSGVCRDTLYAMERMISTVSQVRERYRFTGYIHLKLLPGCEEAMIERAIEIADRVSVNLEAPNASRLQGLSVDKSFDHDLLATLRTASRLRKRMGKSTSQTTQFVVGAAGESDREILSTLDDLYRTCALTRAYFSAFQPIRNTPLEEQPPTPPLREHRLYQSDFLLRHYGFGLQDLVFDTDGNLQEEADPKLAWARAHPEYFPIELNKASREQLLRVPGIGPQTANRILRRRRSSRLRRIEDLRAAGAVAARAAPYVLFDGRCAPTQLALF